MEHIISVKIDSALAKSKDFEILVGTSEGKLGTILISKGNIEWVKSGNSVRRKRLTWEQFATIMEDNGKDVKKQRK